MRKIITEPHDNAQLGEEFAPDDRRLNDRRSCEKNGFTYIPMVGWMCRREKPRRKDDDICGW